MPDPFDTNDDWAELARELERDKPPAPPPAPAQPADMVERLIEAEAVEPHHADPRAEDEAIAEGEPEGAADEEFDDADEVAAPEAGEPTAEGEQPGTGRKRRRRRRRRRKGGGAPGEATAPTASADVTGEASAPDEAEAALEPIADATESDDFDSGLEETADGEFAPLAAEEDTASDVLRDLIANWNVPSWDEIVGGLYRPN